MLDTSCSSMWAQTAEYVSSNGSSTSFMTTSPRPPSPIFFSAGLPSPSEVTTFCKRGHFLFYRTGYIYWVIKKRQSIRWNICFPVWSWANWPAPPVHLLLFQCIDSRAITRSPSLPRFRSIYQFPEQLLGQRCWWQPREGSTPKWPQQSAQLSPVSFKLLKMFNKFTR